MGCIESLKYEMILSGASFKECLEFVEKNVPEVWYVDPGYKIFDGYLIGLPPISSWHRRRKKDYLPVHEALPRDIPSQDRRPCRSRACPENGTEEEIIPGPAPHEKTMACPVF